MAPEMLTRPASEPSTDLAIREEINSAQVIASAVATILNNPAGEDDFIFTPKAVLSMTPD
jgi:hypothetical protein